MNLSKRLQTIYDMVALDEVVADIGADHGKLLISLFLDGKIAHGYAIENKQGPFKRLCLAIEAKGLCDDVVPILADGISELPPSVGTVIIAGMGGKTIVNILKSHIEKLKNVKTIIIDAHSSIPFVRKEVSELGYVIADEKIVKEDNIYYEIIKFVKADIAFYNDQDLNFGPILRNEKSTLFKEKYKERLEKIDHILSSKNVPETKVELLSKEKKMIQGIL